MTQYRVLNRAFIGGRLVSTGDIVDLDPKQVSVRDTHLEPIAPPHSDEPELPHEFPTADPVEDPVSPTSVTSSILPGHIAYMSANSEPIYTSPSMTSSPSSATVPAAEIEHP